MTLNRLPLRKEPNSVAHARSASSDKLREFGLSMIEIEALRLVQEARLKNYANADKLPGSISDPAWLPWLNSNVRKVVEAFQLQAEEVVKKHGIKPDEFNRMLEQTMASRLFRLNVQQQMRKYEDEVSHR